MKSLLLRLASGAGMATAVTIAASTGASASSGADCDHGQSSYQNDRHDQSSWRDDDRKGDVHYASAEWGGRGSGYDRSEGMWKDGQWHMYKDIGYWCDGRWVPYASDWSKNDWDQWEGQNHR